MSWLSRASKFTISVLARMAGKNAAAYTARKIAARVAVSMLR